MGLSPTHPTGGPLIPLSADIAAPGGPADARVGALERIIPLEVVQQVLQETGHARRRCPTPPPWLVVWLVIGPGLFARDSYQMIFKRLQRFRKGATPGRSTPGEARRGPGSRVLRRLAARLAGPPGRPGDAHGFYKGLRLMALDSFTLDLFDSAANARVFGRPGGGRGQGAFPQARVPALCETGSRATRRYQVKPCRRGEIGRAPVLLRHLQPGLLLLWGRNFFGHQALRQVLARGAQLLCRVKSNLIFAPIEALPDGSYLAKAYAKARHRRRDEGGSVARVIDHAPGDPNRPAKEARHRLVTTLLEAEAYPAEELVVPYHERREEELAIDEVKTHRKGRATLRSQAPRGVVQEIDGLLLARYAVRAVMAEAADDAGRGPRRLSFTGSLRALRLRLAEAPARRAPRRRWWAALRAEVGELVLGPRRDRLNPRVIGRQQSKWPKKRPEHRRHPQPTMPFRNSVLIC